MALREAGRERRNLILLAVAFLSVLLAGLQSWWAVATAGIVLISSMALAALLLVQQNARLSREALARRVERLARSKVARERNVMTGVRFDVDLIVAINEFSFTVGNGVVRLVRKEVGEAATALRAQGHRVFVLPMGEGDDINVILPGVDIRTATEFANTVRRRVKAGLETIPGYHDAHSFVCRRLVDPPLTVEEREGIGTVSAGVAAYSRGAEALLSDITSAVKGAKFRGRNKTIVFSPQGPHRVIA